MKISLKNIKFNYGNILLGMLVLCLIILAIVTIVKVKEVLNSVDKDEVSEIKIVDTVKDYGYQLTENHTEYFEQLFNDLKNIIDEKEEAYEEEYAKKIAQLFVADFYDLNSKINKNDVGGVQFVLEPYQETFINFTNDIKGIYYYVENNAYGNREQALPIVNEVEIVSVVRTEFSFEDVIDDNAYQITVDIKYAKDLGYDTTVTLILIHTGKKIEIVEMT